MSAIAPPFRRDRTVHGWIALKAVSDAGDAAWILAVAWSAVTASSPAVAGLIVTAGTIPRALTLLVGGVLADRFDARRMMVATTIARLTVLTAALAALSTVGETIPILFAVAIAFGICDALFEPSSASLTRQLVHERDFGALAGISQTASRIGAMLGAAAGGLLVAGGGLVAAALANAISYTGVLLYLLVLLRVRFPRTPAPAAPLLRSIAEGFGYLHRDRLARSLVLSLLGLNLCVSPALSIGLALLVQHLGSGPALLGALEATFGIGAMTGALIFIRVRPPRPALAGFLLLVLQGAAVASLALGHAGTAFASCAIIGITAGGASTILAGLFLREIAPDRIGRVVSIQRLGDDGLMPAATAAFGGLAALSLPAAFLAFGGVMAAYMSATALRWRHRGAPR
ncbi:MFS transporter [Microbacterium sp. G2-8]|uniref:MFS transporter n=1 Tax=Microbacterium sp. G2-8 TaxID=2842454 RepID=UPI001C8AFD3C|nr:MFS transporter [Microbacterium sp. G2-8]